MTLPKIYQNPTYAYLAWSALAEGHDREARQVVGSLGPVKALEWLNKQDPNTNDECVGRWLPRWKLLDLETMVDNHLRLGRTFLTPAQEDWPENLTHLEETEPFALWIRGNAQVVANSNGSVAIVGARASSHQGDLIAAEMASKLCQAGRTIVSGGAFGIDAAAARGALAAGGKTIAVMAGGVDSLYPTSHVDLLQTITENGAVISEQPPGARPARWRFLDRNRIIAALTDATVVVQAAYRSGALSTANHATELGREVGAVPGPIDSPMSQGCHRLIRQGATLVTNHEEILEMISPLDPTRQGELFEIPPDRLENLNKLEKLIYDALPQRRSAPLETIARTAGKNLTEVAKALGKMELTGHVRQNESGWCRNQ